MGRSFFGGDEMDNDAKRKDAVQDEIQLTDKDLHCIARLLQSEYVGDGVQCLYCKYAFQCREKFFTTHKPPYQEVFKKLKRKTGVDIFLVNPETMQKDILDGSWIEKCSELLQKFTSISFEEQQDILLNPDILRYKDSYNVEM